MPSVSREEFREFAAAHSISTKNPSDRGGGEDLTVWREKFLPEEIVGVRKDKNKRSPETNVVKNVCGVQVVKILGA